jgi:hypothetical protein
MPTPRRIGNSRGDKGDFDYSFKALSMSTRMALTLVCRLPLVLQSVEDYPAKPVRVIEGSGLVVGLT